MTGYETFCLYLALKNHFTTSYDFFKYQGKVRVPADTFLRRRDRFQFEKLARKYSSDQMKDFLVANLREGVKWVGDLLEDQAHERYLSMVKIKQSLTYTFKNDIETAFSSVTKPSELFKSQADSYPPVLQLMMSKTISFETFVILNSFVGFSDKFDKILDGDYVWERLSYRMFKYAPFVEYDRKKFASILKDTMEATI